MTQATRPVVGIDAGALMLARNAPGTAKFVREQTQELLRQSVPWDWVVAVPRGFRDVFPEGPGREVVELGGQKYSIFAMVQTARLWRAKRCIAALSPAGITARFSPVISTYYDSNLFEYGRSAVASNDLARYYLMRWMAADTFRRARGVFVNSRYCTDYLRNRFPRFGSKFVSNPPGLTPPNEVEPERPGWADDRIDELGCVLCSSAFMDNKNQRRLIEAYTLLQNSGHRLPPLVLIGPCPPDYLERVIKPAVAASPAPGDILIPGHVSDGVLAWAYSQARVVVQPSFAEGFSSFSVFQAMQRGVPVACANTSSHPEAVGTAALLFDPSSVPEMAAAIDRLLQPGPEEVAFRQRMVAAGRTRVAELTWAANANRVCSEITKIVEEESARVR